MAAPISYIRDEDDIDTYTQGTNGAAAVRFSTLSHDGNTLPAVYLVGGATPDSIVQDISSESLSEVWSAFYVDLDGATNLTFFEIIGSDDLVLLRGRCANTSEHWYFERQNGSGFTQIGSTQTSPTLSSSVRFDVNLDISDTGTIEVYVEGSSVLSFSGDTLFGTNTTVKSARYSAASTGSNVAVFSLCALDSADTRKLKLFSVNVSSAGTYSGYTGTSANVDNNITINTSDFATFEDAQEGTFNFAGFDVELTDSWTIEDLYLIIQGKAIADPGINLQSRTRVSSTDYNGTNAVQPAAGSAYSYKALRFSTNPATAAAWANKSAIEGAEFGMIGDAA